jgi:hypothetical protein
MSKSSYWQLTGPWAQYAEGFRAELARLGYTQLTAAGSLRWCPLRGDGPASASWLPAGCGVRPGIGTRAPVGR